MDSLVARTSSAYFVDVSKRLNSAENIEDLSVERLLGTSMAKDQVLALVKNAYFCNGSNVVGCQLASMRIVLSYQRRIYMLPSAARPCSFEGPVLVILWPRGVVVTLCV